jgi:hypothetical protein
MQYPPALAVLASSILAASAGLRQAQADTPPAPLGLSTTHSGNAALDLKPVSRAEYLALYERGLSPLRGRQAERTLKALLAPLSAVSSTAAVSGGDPVEAALSDRSAVVGAALGFAAAQGDEDRLTHYEPVFDFLVEGYLDPAHKKHILNPFAPIGFFAAADALDRAGRLTAARREKVHRVALLFQNGRGRARSVGNWDAALAVGQGYASRIFAHEEELAVLRKNAADYCEQLFTKFSGDIENAPYYGAIGAAQIFQAAALNGTTDPLNTPFFRGLVTRLARLVSEEGLQPDYGDYYFGEGYVTLHMYLFEAAARTFQDPRFLRVARRIYERVAASRRAAPVGPYDAVFSLQILSLPPFENAPEPLPAFEVQAQVLKHQRGHRFGSPPGVVEADKVVLKSPTSSVKAYAMLDVGTGGHGIPECRAAVLHYEVNGVPLVRGVNKNHSPEMANQVYLKPPRAEYPHHTRGFEAGVWYTQTVPLDLLAVDYLPEFKWDAIVRGETQWLYLDNIRLEGPGGTQLLESCESTAVLAPWNGCSSEAVLSPDHTEGKHSLKIPLLNGRHGHTFTSLTHKPAIDRTRFHSLKFDWKFEAPKAPWCFMRWGSALRGERGDVFPWSVFCQGTVQKAEAANNEAGDSRARVEMAGYVTADTRWSREVLMSKEGVLVLVDRVWPGPNAEGYTVGSLWQLDNLDAAGNHWFTQKPLRWPALLKGQPDRSAGMFVWHAPSETAGRRIGHQSTKEAPGLFDKVPPIEFRPITTFAAETAKAGKPVAFLTLVAPTHGPDFHPETFAQSIEFRVEDNDADVRCQFGGIPIHFHVSDSGKWSVERPSP